MGYNMDLQVIGHASIVNRYVRKQNHVPLIQHSVRPLLDERGIGGVGSLHLEFLQNHVMPVRIHIGSKFCPFLCPEPICAPYMHKCG
jgi:hypothetical protein